MRAMTVVSGAGWIGAAIATMAICACSSPEEGAVAAPRVYVGVAIDPEGEVSIALAVQDELVAAFVCGRDPTEEEYPGWFTGRTPEAAAHLVKDDWGLRGEWSSDRAEATLVEPDGTELAWTGTRTAPDGLAGLYSAADSGCVTGVVVTEDADGAPVVRGAWCNAEGVVAQVVPLMPVELVAGGLAVEVPLATGTRRLFVEPIRLR